MLYRKSYQCAIQVFGLALIMASASAASGDRNKLRVALEDVPGSTQLEAGKIKAGIEILEKALDNGTVDVGQALATLCGAYLLDRAFAQAQPVCGKAATLYPSKSSLNNYGIYRAAVGDFEGAIASFRKAQPLRREEYIEFLRTKDIGLVAMQNEAVLLDHEVAKSSVNKETIRLSARIEELVPKRLSN